MPLPRPTVSSRQAEEFKTEVVISREGKTRTYTSRSSHGTADATKEIVEQIIADPATAEWLPGKER